MSKSSYYDKDRLDNEGLKNGNDHFNENRYRYSFDKNGGKYKDSVEIEQAPAQRAKITSQEKNGKTIYVIISVVISALVGYLKNSNTNSDYPKLVQYTPPDSSFCVMLPEKVEMEVEAPTNIYGHPILLYMFNAYSKYHAFSILFLEMPKQFMANEIANPFMIDEIPKPFMTNEIPKPSMTNEIPKPFMMNEILKPSMMDIDSNQKEI